MESKNIGKELDTIIFDGRELMFEQDLPEDMTDEQYSKWFDNSLLVWGVRMGDVFILP